MHSDDDEILSWLRPKIDGTYEMWYSYKLVDKILEIIKGGWYKGIVEDIEELING